jgi:hypothetical protein
VYRSHTQEDARGSGGVAALVTNLVVQEVVGQPPALLPEQGHQEGGKAVGRPRGETHSQVHRGSENGQVAGALKHIVQRAAQPSITTTGKGVVTRR